MKQIYKQTKIVGQILENQAIDETQKYRKFHYLTECPVDGGILLLNTITYELLFISDQEVRALNDIEKKIIENNDATLRFLVEHYFLVPEDFHDKEFALQVINTRLQIQNIYTAPPLSHFVILPTTGCNARCFYCFEQGAKISSMTEQTAHDVAKFIKRKAADKIKLQWFGGEPLVNAKAIDIICRDLAAENVDYHSAMVSNGYLLDEDMIKKAVDLWHLRKIQITLDGTEEIYNKIKDYVYKNEISPFQKVVGNIENALKAGIRTNIRLNMDEHNADDLFKLCQFLVKRFGTYDICRIYVVRLFDDTCSKIKNREVSDRHKLIESSMKLQDFINENMPASLVKELPKSFDNPNSCMACSDSSVMIVPDGHLGKCEHFVDSNFHGSIYSDEIDLKKIYAYKERRMVSLNCEDCEFRSLCMPLKCCSGIPYHCDEMDKKEITNRLHTKLKTIYNNYTEINQNG